MVEGEAPCVESLPSQYFLRGLHRLTGLPSTAIKCVAQQRMPGFGEVHANLVRAARVEVDFDQRRTLEPLHHPIQRDCWLAFAHPAGEAHPMDGVAPVQRLETAFRCSGGPVHDREIRLLDLSAFEAGLQRRHRLIVLRDDHATRRVFVEAVNDAGTKLPSHASQIRDPVKQRVDQRSIRVTCSGMYDHARCLIQDEEICVLIQHREGQILRDGFSGRRRGKCERYALPSPKPRGRFTGTSVDGDVPLLNQRLDTRTAELRQRRREMLVEPLTARFRRDDERPALTGHQIRDLMCAFERITMSTMARSKKFAVL